MSRSTLLSIALATNLCCFAAPVFAQDATPVPAAPAPAAPLQKPFSFGDLMDTLVQPRHIKLALAGRAHNWALAGYALHQLRDSFTFIATAKPRFRNQPVADLFDKMTGESILALDQAIKASDARQFTEAYERLTAGCNACHEALGQPVVIKVPDSSAFPDQEFEAKR